MKVRKNLINVYCLMIFFMLIAVADLSYGSSLDKWLMVTSPSDHWFYGMTYGNSKFVTVGDYGTILTSPDGVVWTIRTSGDTHHLNGVGYGINTYVAVGNIGTILTSPDGITWTRRDAGLGHYNNLYGAAYGNNLFVVVGSSGTIATSSGGPNWIWNETSVGTSNWLFGIVYGSQFVDVGSFGEIDTSTTGASWNQIIPFATNKHLYAVTYGNSMFVAVGQQGIVLTSLNGLNWTITRNPQAYYADLYGVAFGTVGGFGYFVAVGQYGAILTSQDGTNWESRTSGTVYDLEAVAYDVNHQAFAATGEYGIILLDGDNLLDPVWIPSVHHMYRGPHIQDAYYNAFDGDTIESMALHFPEDLNFFNNISVTLKGGYNSTFTENPSATTIDGSLIISDGTVTVENVIIQ
jgi:hypothetical protein